jgi:hypothetical protein
MAEQAMRSKLLAMSLKASRKAEAKRKAKAARRDCADACPQNCRPGQEAAAERSSKPLLKFRPAIHRSAYTERTRPKCGCA